VRTLALRRRAEEVRAAEEIFFYVSILFGRATFDDARASFRERRL
jgi:hypothetical protein